MTWSRPLLPRLERATPLRAILDEIAIGIFVMKHVRLGRLDVGRVGLGAMGMSVAYTGAGRDDAESIRTIHRAIDLGVTLIDTAEVYGPYTNEELVGRALKGHRENVVLATKFGMISHTGRGPGAL